MKWKLTFSRKSLQIQIVKEIKQKKIPEAISILFFTNLRILDKNNYFLALEESIGVHYAIPSLL